MYTKDAVHAGGSAQSAWTWSLRRGRRWCSTTPKRAAPELGGEGHPALPMRAGGASDEAWSNAVEYFDEDELVALFDVIAVINAYNPHPDVINRAVSSATTSPASGATGPSVVGSRPDAPVVHQLDLLVGHLAAVLAVRVRERGRGRGSSGRPAARR